MSENHLIVFLFQILLILGAARFIGEVFNLKGLPALSAEILVGVLLGPTVLGHLAPQAHAFIFPDNGINPDMLQTMAWLGAFFLLLEIGLEVDFTSAWRHRSKALIIALVDMVVPLTIGFTASYFLLAGYLPQGQSLVAFSLFMAMVVTICAMPVAARALYDLNMSKTDLGFLILSALSVNDVVGWLLFAVVFGFIFSSGQAAVLPLVLTFAAATVFMGVCMVYGGRFSDAMIWIFKRLRFPEPGASLTYIFLLGVLCAVIMHQFGMHPMLGFFVAGIMAGSSKGLSEKSRSTISQMVYAIFIPIFFVHIGLRLDFSKHFDFLLVIVLTVLCIGARYIGAWLGARLAQVERDNCNVVAIAHTPGGLMEIVMGLLALEYGLINDTLFIGIVVSALISAMVMGPWLNLALNRRREFSVFEYFIRQGIVMPLKVSTREEVIDILGTVGAHEVHTHDAAEVISAALDRERLMGTALEEGVAVPHARLEGLRKPMVIFGRSLSGIEWNSPDGKPAQFIFLILTPKNDEHVQVQILRAIAKVMHEPDNAQAILNAKDAHEVWHIFQHAFASRFIKNP